MQCLVGTNREVDAPLGIWVLGHSSQITCGAFYLKMDSFIIFPPTPIGKETGRELFDKLETFLGWKMNKGGELKVQDAV